MQYGVLTGADIAIETFTKGENVDREQRPFLISYAWLAHKFLPRSTFLRQFTRACTAWVEPAEARAIGRAYKVYYDASTVEEPYSAQEATRNGLEPATSVPWPGNFDDHTFYGQVAVDARREQWLKLIQKKEDTAGEAKRLPVHIITRSVDPLVWGLVLARRGESRVTIEFAEASKEFDRVIDVARLREEIDAGRYTGVVRDGTDTRSTDLFTYIVLLLVGSSSGIPLYASRNWDVVVRTWFAIVKDAGEECWLARKGDSPRAVEIHERRLLELVVRVVATTHVSDEEVRRFRPGALGYAAYTRKYYDRMVRNDVLGRVRTDPFLKKQDTPVPEQRFFPQRLRFEEEFSYPRDLDDLCDAVRVRLGHWLFGATIRFV